jgi:hypothetical protein
MIANGLDYLVFLKRFRGEGEQRRVVHSVREVVGYDGEVLKTNEIFKPGRDGMAARDLPVGIHRIDRLRDAGFRDLGEQGRWA